jgi:hypothetical protein
MHDRLFGSDCWNEHQDRWESDSDSNNVHNSRTQFGWRKFMESIDDSDFDFGRKLSILVDTRLAWFISLES